MIIRDIDDSHLSPAHGILFKQIYPNGGEDLADWGFGRSVISPAGHTEPHAHEENEIFLILEGAGEMDIDGERTALVGGQAVAIPANHRHSLSNTSPDAPLSFINIYWPPSFGAVDL